MMSSLVSLLIVFILTKNSIEWSCPNGEITVHADEQSRFPIDNSDGNNATNEYDADSSCLLNFVVPEATYIKLDINFQPSSDDSLTISDDFGLDYIVTNKRLDVSVEFAANFSFFIQSNNNISGLLSVTWKNYSVQTVNPTAIDVFNGSFQVIYFNGSYTSLTVSQMYISQEPFVLIFPIFVYSLQGSKTFFYQGDALTGKYLGGIYNNRANLTIDTVPYTISVVTDYVDGPPDYHDLDQAVILITHLKNVQPYYSFTFYVDNQRPLNLAAGSLSPAAVVVGCPLVVLDAQLTENAYVEWYPGVVEPGDVPIAAFDLTNTTLVSSGIYLPEGGNTLVVYSGSVHFIISSQTPIDHLPISGGVALAVTPNYGSRGLSHTYNWTYIATEYAYYDITITSVICEDNIAWFNFVYFGRSTRLNAGDTLTMYHISNFKLEYVETESSTGGKVVFNASMTPQYNPHFGPPVGECSLLTSTTVLLLFTIFQMFLYNL